MEQRYRVWIGQGAPSIVSETALKRLRKHYRNLKYAEHDESSEITDAPKSPKPDQPTVEAGDSFDDNSEKSLDFLITLRKSKKDGVDSIQKRYEEEGLTYDPQKNQQVLAKELADHYSNQG